MTIAVYDTSTGTELSVRDVTRELARRDEAEYLPCPWGEQIEADLGCTFAAWSGQLDAFAADIRAVLAEYQREPINVPMPMFADLPPDPALQLTPQALDAEHAQAMAIQAERRRRMDALAPVGRRSIASPSLKPFVPRVPWSRRVKTWASGWAEWLKPSGGER